MKIYHGSIEVVKTPEIRESNRTNICFILKNHYKL